VNSAALFFQPFLKMVAIYVRSLVEKTVGGISNWNEIGWVGIPTMF